MSTPLACAVASIVVFSGPLVEKDDSVRVTDQPRFRARDGSVSEIHRGAAASKTDGAVRLLAAPGRLTLTFVWDDASGCTRTHSVEHRIVRDTIVVTLFNYAPALCPQISTPTVYTLTVTSFKPGRYFLRVYREGRGGRWGEASGAPPWLSVSLCAL